MDLQRKGYSALLVMNQNANQSTKKILEAKVKIFEHSRVITKKEILKNIFY
jgi:hypothetical protein